MINPIMVYNFSYLFSSRRLVVHQTKRYFQHKTRAGLSLVCYLVIRGSTGGFLLLWYLSSVVSHPWAHQVSQYVVSVESSSLIDHRSYT